MTKENQMFLGNQEIKRNTWRFWDNQTIDHQETNRCMKCVIGSSGDKEQREQDDKAICYQT